MKKIIVKVLECKKLNSPRLKKISTVFIFTITVQIFLICCNNAQKDVVQLDESTNKPMLEFQNNQDKFLAKVSNDLTTLYFEQQSYLSTEGRIDTFKSKNSYLKIIDGMVLIDAIASSDAGVLRKDLEALGMHKAVVFGSIVSGWLPINAIKEMTELRSLQFARPAYSITHGETNQVR